MTSGPFVGQSSMFTTQHSLDFDLGFLGPIDPRADRGVYCRIDLPQYISFSLSRRRLPENVHSREPKLLVPRRGYFIYIYKKFFFFFELPLAATLFAKLKLNLQSNHHFFRRIREKLYFLNLASSSYESFGSTYIFYFSFHFRSVI